jgi:hypothetical protein
MNIINILRTRSNPPQDPLYSTDNMYADVLIGILSLEEFINKYKKAPFNDIYNIISGGPINWTAQDNNAKEYAYFKFPNCLVSRYFQTKNITYINRYISILLDFVTRQKAQTNSPVYCNWTTQAQSALSQATRVVNILNTLTVIAKLLPPHSYKSYDSVSSPNLIPPSNYNLIDSTALQTIINSLMTDHMDALLKRFLTAGAVPNQRFIGLSAIAHVAFTFDDKTNQNKVIPAFEDFFNTMFHKDGGMLETSFNYNLIVSDDMDDLIKYVLPKNQEITKLMIKKDDDFLDMLYGLLEPTYELPRVGNYYGCVVPKLWLGGWNTWLNLSEDNPNKLPLKVIKSKSSPPNFTSVNFPYSGYVALRDGWNFDNLYLFLNNARSARGHCMRDTNSIQITAYGRKFLTTAGPDTYDDPNITKEVYDYFDESNSIKTNTIMVNGLSQTSRSQLNSAPSTPVNARWFSSDDIDFAEGIHATGYGPNYLNVVHNRQIYFIKKHKFWIVVDDLFPENLETVYKYSQLWHFQPPSSSVAAGFIDSTVIINPEESIFNPHKSQIKTTDPGAPNIVMHQFGYDQTYKKYYGNKSPYNGWYSENLFSPKVPAVEIHVEWSGRGDQRLVTFIEPLDVNQIESKVYVIENIVTIDEDKFTFGDRGPGTLLDLYGITIDIV